MVEEASTETYSNVPMVDAMPFNDARSGDTDNVTEATPFIRSALKQKPTLAQPQAFVDKYHKHTAFFNVRMVVTK